MSGSRRDSGCEEGRPSGGPDGDQWSAAGGAIPRGEWRQRCRIYGEPISGRLVGSALSEPVGAGLRDVGCRSPRQSGAQVWPPDHGDMRLRRGFSGSSGSADIWSDVIRNHRAGWRYPGRPGWWRRIGERSRGEVLDCGLRWICVRAGIRQADPVSVRDSGLLGVASGSVLLAVRESAETASGLRQPAASVISASIRSRVS